MNTNCRFWYPIKGRKTPPCRPENRIFCASIKAVFCRSIHKGQGGIAEYRYGGKKVYSIDRKGKVSDNEEGKRNS